MEQDKKIYSHTKKNGVKAVILCFIIVVGSDSILRVLDAYGMLWEPNDWGNRPNVASKINECMGLFNQNQGKFKIVAIGDSMIEMALDPVLLDSYFDNKTITYNFGIAGTAVRFQKVYLEKVILPKLKPDFVIWHFNPVDFWNWTPVNEEEWEILGSSMGRYHTENTTGLDFFGQVNQFLLHNSPLYKNRGYFVPPWFDFSIYWGLIAPSNVNGYWRTYDQQYTSNDTMIINRPGITPNVDGYPVSFDTLSASQLLESLSFIEAKGLDYLVVYGPFNHFNYSFPELDSLFESIPQWQFLNLNGNESLMWDELYYNFNHLNAYGSHIFTQFVFEKVKNQIEIKNNV